MQTSGNGARPPKSSEQVAAELHDRLEGMLGRQRAEQIWRDPTAIQRIVEDEAEAAAVAETIFRAWRDLPKEEPPGKPRRSGFRRGLQIALVAAVAVWSLSVLRRLRQGEDG
ncbi:MAG: hypothetical protein U1B78_03620 [Dehalococcoidia bacterium]|nr:hypothetical protein [Dehalococcoidia bacterium]